VSQAATHRRRQHVAFGPGGGTLWFIAHVDRGTGVPLGRYRPWYRQKVAPSQLDMAEACREALHEAGIFPIPRFTPELAENDEKPAHALPLAA